MTAQIQKRSIPVENANPEAGLTSLQAEQRMLAGWGNQPPKSASKSEKEIILSHCFTFFNMVFAVLAAILVIGGSSVKNMAFLVVAVINTVIGIFQEIRAKRAVERLTLVAAARLRAIRNGRQTQILSTELVRDDIVEYHAGDQLCADGILRTGQLQVNESLITGEADAVVKNPGDELRSGSFVVAGIGRAQLTLVGADAFAARLAAEAKANPHAAKSGMMLALDRLIRVVGIALIPIGLIMFYQHFQVLKLGLRGSAESTVAALVGMIPEGLYLLTSVALAASAVKLSRQRVLVRDMGCIETLARVDTLCVDKTGTITEPKMEVEQVIPLTADSPEALEQLLSAFYGDTEPENDTARAMTEMFSRSTDWRCTRRIPFTSDTKWSAAEFDGKGVTVIGAPECIMGSRFPEVADTVGEWTALGYRVLLVAEYDDFPDNRVIAERLLRPMALVALTNRIRPEAPRTFSYFREQGVTVKVISGDSPATAADVARRAGIPETDRYIDTSALETEADFREAAEKYTVFGRVTPDKKKKLIRAMKQNRHTVAMTGDGVNDVLAMKEADCGIAMASGAQAASQVAQLVLLNSDFASMPGIVGEGRRVINNIQRAAALFLVKNIFAFFLSLIAVCTGLPFPLMPLHLTVISTTTIGIPSFFLAMEPNYERVSGGFLAGTLRRALPGGLCNILMVLAALAVMSAYSIDMAEISAVCTAVLALVGLLVLLQVCRPMDTWRWIVWGAMAALLLVCFLPLRVPLSLALTSRNGLLSLAVLLAATPGVFLAVGWLCRLLDRVCRKLLRTAPRRRHCD